MLPSEAKLHNKNIIIINIAPPLLITPNKALPTIIKIHSKEKDIIANGITVPPNHIRRF